MTTNNNSPYIRTEAQQKRHNEIIQKVALNLIDNGFGLLVDHIDWSEGIPPQVEGIERGSRYTPDIFAMKLGLSFIVEVETADSLDNNYTINQLMAFDVAARDMKNGHAHLVLPSSIGLNAHLQKAKDLKARYKLNNTSIFLYNFFTKNVEFYC